SVGTEYSRESSNIRLINVDAGPDSTTTDASINQDNLGVFAQAVATLTSRLTVTGGLRFDYVRIPYRDNLDPTNDGTSTYHRWSPEIGSVYQFTDQFKAFIAYKS